MPASLCKPNLSTQLLQIIKDHGPITIDLLQRMTSHPMPKTNLRQSLAMLKKRGLIDGVCLGPQTTYYQTSQALPSRREIAERLSIGPDEITHPLLRKQDWAHNQWCEFWAHAIKRIYPDVQIIREDSIGSYEIAKNILQVKEQDFDLLPDLLLIFPKSEEHEAISIAFEIERTRKSDRRIMRKLRKYLMGTRIDGLIYICDSGRLSETIRMLYEKKLAEQALRIGHYGEHFFLFSDSMAGGGPELNRLFNAKGQAVNFIDWCLQLRKTKRTLRRDAQFEI